ncbi:exo-beta-N-acetylmuramidase NamZ domain-containing protein [Caldisericum exile]|uniref:exo-beta-N-acetylmuramidase NamZ domain-containing protein n=1 Tax=Caldisericum exile TaxID=693075 RepID=UPI003C72E051
MGKVGLDRVNRTFRNFALFTNASGINSKLLRNIEILDPAFILTGEHGLYLEADRGKSFSLMEDDFSGKPVYPIYPDINEDLFDKVEGVVIDIQDVGVRCFTFIYNLKKIIEIASRKSLKVVVLDRFNPIGRSFGSVCEKESIVCPMGIPFLYPFSIGKLARIFSKPFSLNIEVIETEGALTYEEMEKFLSNVSQNLNSYQSVLLYPALVFLEGFQDVSVGRGTNKPFRMVLSKENIASVLETFLKGLGINGVYFNKTISKPCFDTLANERLFGIEFFVYDKDDFDPVLLGFNLFKFFYERGYKLSYDESGTPFIELIYPHLLEAVESQSLFEFYNSENEMGKAFLSKNF